MTNAKPVITSSHNPPGHFDPKPRMIGIEVGEWQDEHAMPGYTRVAPIWADVDRPDVGGWIAPTPAMAQRLVRALQAGVVFSDIEIKTDVNGKTYVCTTSRVMGKYMNADLKRLGF